MAIKRSSRLRHVDAARASLLCFLAFLASYLPVPIVAAAQPAATSVNALADRYIDEVKRRFPLRYAGAGLPSPPRDVLDINSPAELAAWWSFVETLQKEVGSVRSALAAGDDSWITLAVLDQTLSQDRAIQTCRLDLWQVTTFSWQFGFGQVAELQPVGDEARRAAILARFRHMPRFARQHIENLREGARLGFTAPRTAVNAVLKQLNAVLAEPISKSSYFSPIDRDADESFRRAWLDILETSVRPTLQSYRDFLHQEYLPKARVTAGIAANKNGAACYRALLKANTSIDVTPEDLYARAVARRKAETDAALQAAQRRYGREFRDLASVAAVLRSDPSNQFKSAEEIREFIVATMKRTKAASGRVVPRPPATDVDLKAYPEAVEATAPAGQYVAADAEGLRAPLYYYSADYKDLTPAELEATVLHEVWPGHHLQWLITGANAASGHRELAKLVYVPGLGEGWATYVESLAREMRLYASDLGIIGSVMDSLTPYLVADIGMHVLGWSEQRTFDYLRDAYPSMPTESIQRRADTIAEEPGFVVSYTAGAMEIEALREEAHRSAGERFDIRMFHQLILEDGTVPFPALRAKLAKAQRRLQ